MNPINITGRIFLHTYGFIHTNQLTNQILQLRKEGPHFSKKAGHTVKKVRRGGVRRRKRLTLHIVSPSTLETDAGYILVYAMEILRINLRFLSYFAFSIHVRYHDLHGHHGPQWGTMLDGARP